MMRSVSHRLTLCLFLCTLSDPWESFATSSNDRMQLAIDLDIKHSSNFEAWGEINWTRIDPAIVLGSEGSQQILNKILDHPLGRPGYSSLILPAIVDLALRFRVLPPHTLSEHRAKEQQYYRRILDDRNPWLLRKLGLTSEYPEVSKPSSYFVEFENRRRIWATSLEKLEKLRRESAPISEIAAAEAHTERARVRWNTMGHREIVTVLLQRYQFNNSLNPELVWEESDQEFLLNGGALWRYSGTSPTPRFSPSLEDLRRNRSLWRKIKAPARAAEESFEFNYVIVRVDRPWLDPGILFFNSWEWDNAFPLGKEYRVSNGRGCRSDDPFPCLIEFLIVIGGADDPLTNMQVYGVVGESLNRVPPNAQNSEVDTNGMDQIKRNNDRDLLVKRLRNGSF